MRHKQGISYDNIGFSNGIDFSLNFELFLYCPNTFIGMEYLIFGVFEMNTIKPVIVDDVPQIAPSLIDFVVDDVEFKDGYVEFNLIYKYDSDCYVCLICPTVEKIGEIDYLPKGTIDPQDSLLGKFEYPEVVGFSTVTKSHQVFAHDGCSIMLTEDQEQKLNAWMYEDSYYKAERNLK